MTVVSFITFAGILWWAYVRHQEADFAPQRRCLSPTRRKRHG
jgi:cytochrome c oxidase cbb3-type subunit 4